MTDTILDGEVGPELEAYVNALLDRIRDLEAELEEKKRLAREAEVMMKDLMKDLLEYMQQDLKSP